MAISVEKLSGESIVLVKVFNPLIPDQDIPHLLQELSRVFDNSPEPLFDITDTSGVKMSFVDMVNAVAKVTKGDHNPLQHPNVIGYAIVADSKLAQIGAQALGQVKHGGISATIVGTFDEALAVAREAIASHGARL